MKVQLIAALLLFMFFSAGAAPCRSAGPGDVDREYSPRAAMHLSRANILLKKGDQVEAEKELRLAVREDPRSEYLRLRLVELLFQLERYRDVVETLRSPEIRYEDVRAYLYLGLAYQYVGEKGKAAEAFDSIYGLESATAEDFIHVGKIFSYEEKYEEALRFYSRAGEMVPESADLHSLKGEVYIAMEDMEKAREEYRKSVEIEPDRISSWMVLAQLAESEEDWREALEYYGIILGLSEHPTSVLESIMRLSGRIGDFSQAIEITRGLVEKFPDNGLLWGLLGVLYYQVESLEEANQALGKAIEMGVSSFQLYLTLGRSLMELGMGEAAIMNLEKAVSLEPKELIGWINLALAYFSVNEHEKALDRLGKALEIQPESSQALYMKGVVLSRMERYVEAIGPLERAMAAAPENKEIIFGLAVALERSDRSEKAEELLQKILLIDPGDSQAMNYLGYMWAERGENLDEAEKLIARAIELEPENGYYIDSIAWVHYQRGDYEKALQEMLRSVELADDDPVIFEHLGDVYHKLGRVDEAIEAWEKSLEVDPETPGVREKIESLKGAD